MELYILKFLLKSKCTDQLRVSFEDFPHKDH